MLALARLPRLSARVPKRGSEGSRQFWYNLAHLAGWQIIGDAPDIPKAVVIAGPHTSYWDGLVAAVMILSFGVELHVLAKEELYKAPFKSVLDWFKVIPVDRSSPHGLVARLCHEFATRPRFWLAMSPEGTRKAAPRWRSGFYRIAVAAGVPIVMVGLDYKRKAVVFLGVFEPTGDYARDLPQIIEHFAGLEPLNRAGLSAPLKRFLPDEWAG